MKYVSELTGKKFDTEAECLADDAEYQRKMEEKKAKKEALNKERAEAAEKVEEAIKDAAAAIKTRDDLLNDFCSKYGKFHMSLKDCDDPILSDRFSLFNFWRW